MITNIEDYFIRGCGRCARYDTPDCSTRPWVPGLGRLRDVCRGADLVETVKWGHPCYGHAGRNVAIIGAFRSYFRLSFFHAALMQDPECILEREGSNTEHPGMIRFTSNDRVAELEPVIRAYLHEAMGYAERGVTPPKETREPDLPDELLDALDADPDLGEAFARLTPGRRKSYILSLCRAKQPQTRRRRIAGFRCRILAGKGATER